MLKPVPMLLFETLSKQSKNVGHFPCVFAFFKEHLLSASRHADESSFAKKSWETLVKLRLSMVCTSESNVDISAPKPHRRRRTKAQSKAGNIQEPNNYHKKISILRTTAPSNVGFLFLTAMLKMRPVVLSSLCLCSIRQIHSKNILASKSFSQEVQSLSNFQGKINKEMMSNNIYCQGSLLAAVQTARLFGDCKHFVDMPLKRDPELTLKNWNELINKVGDGAIEPAVLAAFVSEHFEQPGDELEEHEPTDFQNNVTSFAKIADPAYRMWAMELHRKWPTLCRRVSGKVFNHPERYSLIPLPNPFVVPGGRFREMYYWDSFFTIKGLIASQMYSTVRQMIENMGWLIENFGFVPNGNRIYYLNRSQPPLLTWCVHAYYQATGDINFLQRAMGWLEREMQFFVENRRILKTDWKTHLFRYHVVTCGPRPESYREDVESAEHITDTSEKRRLWGDIMAAAESGRDFSARWFHADGPFAGQMGSTRTSSILPVDLNSIICGNLRTFADFYAILGRKEESEKALIQFKLMRETIHQVFWNEDHGCWFDYDLEKEKHICTYFDTNFFPLLEGIVHDNFDLEKFQNYLRTVGVLDYPGGVPSSLIASGHQWDYPFNFPSTTWVIIEGLRVNKMSELAKSIAEKWIRRNYDMWINNGGRMFEKYNVATLCYKAFGGGGEYELQEGFGWTNGVILDLLLKYGNELFWEKREHFEPECKCCTSKNETSTTTTSPQDSFIHCGLEDSVVVNCGILQKA